jgi:dihydrofolate reductase
MVDDYLARRDAYRMTIMGRRTYEFGYNYGLRPGDNPYPHMRTLILSKTLSLPPKSAVEQIGTDAVAFVRQLKGEANNPIYLCGGGELAGSLARAGLIDTLILKRLPLMLGGGTRLFGEVGASLTLTQTDQIDYGGGKALQTFQCGGT